MENVYCFFSASDHRWAFLVDSLDGLPVVKRLNDARWSSYADATKLLNLADEKIIEDLELFAENMEEKSITRQEAKGIL